VNNLVDIGSVQNITWVKTFTAFPLTPSSAPTTDYQVTNKKYVDDNFITPTSSNTFSNKTINLSANTFVTTVAQLNTAISDWDLMTSELAIAYAVAL
jgi:hypothetical protein